MDKKVEIISYKELLHKNRIDTLGMAKDFTDYRFCHYTNGDAAVNILNNRTFRASSLNIMNDLAESDFHNNCDKVHSLCFCNSRNEQIPLWYLYGGIFGQGISIVITPKLMLDFIRTIETIRPVSNPNKVLYRSKGDFDLEYGWVYYRRDVGKYYHKNKTYYTNDINRFETNNYFIKDHAWEYEKEFRIIIINNTKESYEKFDIDIPDEIFRKLKLVGGPEFYKSNVRVIENVVNKSRLVGLGTPQESKLKVKMNLLNKNKDEIIRNIRVYFEKEGNVDAELVVNVIEKVFGE